MDRIKISIIIPAFNEENRIGNCIKSIIETSTEKPFEIIVIDNGSTDKTSEIARSFEGVKVVRENKKGVMHARQRGISESTGDIVAFIDADNIIPRDWILTAIKEFEKDPSLVCLTGPYTYYDIDGFKKNLASFYWNVIVFLVWKVLGYVGNFGNMLIRKETLEKMDGLDTSISFYGDDTNTAKRASKFGKVKFNPKLIIQSSARRFEKEGLLKTTLIYAWNFFGEVFLNRPLTKTHKDIR